MENRQSLIVTSETGNSRQAADLPVSRLPNVISRNDSSVLLAEIGLLPSPAVMNKNTRLLVIGIACVVVATAIASIALTGAVWSVHTAVTPGSPFLAPAPANPNPAPAPPGSVIPSVHHHK